MSCGYWLRLNGQWVALDGVQAGVGRDTERASSSMTSVGGVRHSQSARRAARSWTLDFGQAGPESVTALAIAAQGDGNDVMLWDESIARQNLLDPIPLSARPGYPVVMCGAMPLVSMTAGPSEIAPAKTEDVKLKANVTLTSASETGVSDTLPLTPGAVDAFVKIAIPPTPEGMGLVSAELVLTAASGASGTINAHVTSNAWTEGRGDVLSWDDPVGALLGSAAAAQVTTVPLGDLSAYVGTDLSIRLSQTGGTNSTFRSRFAVNPPLIRITYAVLATDRVFTQHLRSGGYTLACWTDAPGGTEFGKVTVDVGLGPIDLPLTASAGSGMRYIAAPVNAAAPVDATFTIWDSPDYSLAGLMMSTLNHPGVYMAAQKTPVRVRVEDPTLVLDRLLPGEQGFGQRTATLSEVGA